MIGSGFLLSLNGVHEVTYQVVVLSSPSIQSQSLSPYQIVHRAGKFSFSSAVAHWLLSCVFEGRRVKNQHSKDGKMIKNRLKKSKNQEARTRMEAFISWFSCSVQHGVHKANYCRVLGTRKVLPHVTTDVPCQSASE